MDLKELNHAGEHAIFGSIEVLGDIDGKGMRTIRREINSMQQQQASFTKKFENYWSDLSSDGVITPVEKASLLKEWEGITQSYTALYEQASEKQLTNTPYWIDYEDAFDALKEELFTTEKIFDNMYESTTLSDKDAFDTIFSEYYYAEKFVTLAITAGLIDKLGLRALTSLSDPGQNGDLGLYRGELYQMVDGVWTKIGTETYLGILDELPEDPLDTQYFLAGDVIVFFDELYINEEPLLINGEKLGVVRLTEVGKLYYYNGEHWALAEDDDPRYLAVLSDYMTLNNALPDVMNAALVNVAKQQLNVKNYLGVASLAPVSANNGDYFVYSGIETTDWKPGRIYIKKNNQWKKLEPVEDGASQYYMTALQDILTLEAAGDGYFSTVFCNSFFANKASINALKVHTIYLETTGAIESADQQYSPGSVGLRIDSSGNIDANGNTHIGGTCTIDGNTTIGGNATISADVNIGGNSRFTGYIDTDKECFAAGFELRGLQPGSYSLKTLNVQDGTIYWVCPASGTVRMAGTATTEGAVGGGVDFYINGNRINRVTLQDSISIDFNINVSAGDTIGVQPWGNGGAGALPRNITTFTGGLYTATRNSLVTFLGQTITTPTPPSPAR